MKSAIVEFILANIEDSRPFSKLFQLACSYWLNIFWVSKIFFTFRDFRVFIVTRGGMTFYNTFHSQQIVLMQAGNDSDA